jgi:outer membrane receptor protein involved in Fe transport
MGNGWTTTSISQPSAGFTLRGPQAFSLWSDPVTWGVGMDFHRIGAVAESDPISQSTISVPPGTLGFPAGEVGVLGEFLTGNQRPQPPAGYSVTEGFGETLIPIAKGMPWVVESSIDAAIRYADYSTTGGVVSWKVGGVYSPIDDLRFRVTRSRDVRAPNIAELFGPLLGSGGPINDPITHTNNNVFNYSGGNPNLKPEIANTFTGGMVYTPSWLDGFNTSVDYYDIQIKGAIGTLSGQVVVNECAEGVTSYCQYVTRAAGNVLQSVTVTELNLNQIEVSGVDFETNYTMPLNTLFESSDGSVKFRALASYLGQYSSTDPFGNVTQDAGLDGGEANGFPRWQGSVSGYYTDGPVGAFLQERFISPGIYSTLYVQGGTGSNGINDNHVGGRAYTDVSLHYDFSYVGGNYQLYTTINNLLNAAPPPSPTRTGAPTSIMGTNGTIFDTVGRYFTVGLRVAL